MYAALINTHKRGVALALFPVEPSGNSFEQAVGSLLEQGRSAPEQIQLHQSSSIAKQYRMQDRIFAVCSGLTAENLSHLYSHSIEQIGITEQQISAVGVLVGPGSFTGLRLGTAFANGLNFGRTRKLWAIESHPESNLIDELKATHKQVLPEFWGQPSNDQHDPYAVPLAFADLYLSLIQWTQGRATMVERLEPRYGREPTPVIKLRQQREQSSQ